MTDPGRSLPSNEQYLSAQSHLKNRNDHKYAICSYRHFATVTESARTMRATDELFTESYGNHNNKGPVKARHQAGSHLSNIYVCALLVRPSNRSPGDWL